MDFSDRRLGHNRLTLDGFVCVVLGFCFYFYDLSVDFIGQQVNGTVEIFIDSGAVNTFSLHP